MSPSERVSVVIPCHNAARYIAAALRSVLAQQEVQTEVLVVDDGSTDGSAEIVERGFPSVRLIRQANAGVANARNRGIAEAQGAWIAFIDADDIWLPGKLRLQLSELASTPSSRMICSAWYVWESMDPEPDPELMQFLAAESPGGRWDGPSGDIYPDLLLDCHVWTSTVLACRDLLNELGGFDCSLRIGEDYDLWLRASRLTSILRVPLPLALYRHHADNITRKVPAANHKGEVIERAIRRWGYLSPAGRKAGRREVARGLSRSWSDFAGAHLIGGQPEVARKAAMHALATDPGQLLAWTVLLKSWWRLLRRVS